MTKPPTLLVVDNDISTRLRLKKLGESLGFRVLTAHSGDHALERLRDQPTVMTVITEVNMKPVGGLTILRHIRSSRSEEMRPKTLIQTNCPTGFDRTERVNFTQWVPEHFGDFASFALKSPSLAVERTFLEEILAARQ